MNKLIVLAVVGFAATISAAELGLEGLKPSELKEIEKEIAAGNVPPNFTAEKPKRGVAKLTNADSPSFNHLNKPYSQDATYSAQQQATYSVQPQASYSVQPQTSYSAQPAYSQAAAAYQQQPYRLVYPNQYYPSNQYLSYLQNPQLASQIAQYAYQPTGQVPHYVQTPTQIQYVSPPNYQSVPSAQYKALTSKTPSASASSAAHPNQATSQVLLPSNMGVYQQPQVVMYLIPQQQLAQQHVYPGHQMLLVGAQNPLLGLYNQHRFGVPSYSTSAVSQQLAYLAAAAQQQQQYQSLQSAAQQQATADQSQKAINVPDTPESSSNTYGVRTKA